MGHYVEMGEPPHRNYETKPIKATVPIEFPYQQTFDAICAAVDLDGLAISVSVKKFEEAFNNHQDALHRNAPLPPSSGAGEHEPTRELLPGEAEADAWIASLPDTDT